MSKIQWKLHRISKLSLMEIHLKTALVAIFCPFWTDSVLRGKTYRGNRPQECDAIWSLSYTWCTFHRCHTQRSYVEGILEVKDTKRSDVVTLGLYSLRRRRLISIGIPIINLRRLSDRLRFIMGIPIPVKTYNRGRYTAVQYIMILQNALQWRDEKHFRLGIWCV